jgi:hypothetical protein
MLLLILLAAALAPSQQASLECANIASAQTEPVAGPAGASAVFKLTTEDDHSKNSHLCNAEYQLLISGAAGTPHVVDVLTSNGDWGRSLSLHLSGFSQDGKRVFGIFTEGGKYPLTMVFDSHASDEIAQLIDITKQFKSIMSADCSASFEVIGTTPPGAIVLELNSAKPCGSSRRWLVDSSGKKPQPLSQGTAVSPLYNANAATP